MRRKHKDIIQKTPKKAKKPRKSKIEKPFADGTMSKAAFFAYIKNALRRRSRFFRPISNCRLRNRIPYIGSNKRRKWMYKCEECHKEYDVKNVQVHHDPPIGPLGCFNDLPRVVEIMFCNSDKLRLLCSDCHNKQHKKEE